MKNYIYIIVIFIFFSFLTYAQQFSLSGKIIDAENNVELIGAKIKLLPTNRSRTTDVRGKYSFDNLSSGTYVLKCFYLGYVEYMDILEFKEGGLNTKIKNILMTPIQSTNINFPINLYRKSLILNAYADNYHLKINEPVKITIHFTSPGDFEKGKPHLGFDKLSDMEIISGDNLYQNSLSKGQNIDMTIYVKFIKKKIYNLNIRFFKYNKVQLTFYIGGAFRESKQVKNIKRDLASLKNAIENYKNKQTQIPIEIIRSTSHYKYIKSQTIIAHNKYEKLIIKELEKKNTELFNTLKQELDSLRQEARKINKDIKRQEYIPPSEGEPYLWQKQERDSLTQEAFN